MYFKEHHRWKSLLFSSSTLKLQSIEFCQRLTLGLYWRYNTYKTIMIVGWTIRKLQTTENSHFHAHNLLHCTWFLTWWTDWFNHRWYWVNCTEMKKYLYLNPLYRTGNPLPVSSYLYSKLTGRSWEHYPVPTEEKRQLLKLQFIHSFTLINKNSKIYRHFR